MFIKFYKGDTLVCSLFIASGKEVTAKLPAGTYKIKAAIGKTWFGQKEAFGDANAHYEVIYENYKMTRNWITGISVTGGESLLKDSGIGRANF
jgi:hypothetical protein